MIAKFKSYWASKESNIHALIILLSGGSGLATVEMLGFTEHHSKLICGAAIVLGALLFTPSNG